ncbi:MAG: hypothetical protein ACEPOZ_14085 [Marinifilaceae bacterium]
MVIKNHNRATNIKFGYYLITFLYLAAIATGLYLEVPRASLYAGCLTLLFILILAFSFSLKLNYIIYMDNADKIVLRHYPLHPFHDKFKSIEIPKNEFSHFVIQKKLFNLRSELILFQTTSRGLAKFPPISISALPKKSQIAIINSLSQFANRKAN